MLLLIVIPSYCCTYQILSFIIIYKQTYRQIIIFQTMELQPQVISFLRFNAPQYQYKPSEEAKIHQKKYLEMYYKTNPDNCFVQLVETLFSDRYLYEHAEFRSLVEKNKKGYVHIDVIFQQQLVKKFLKEMDNEKPGCNDVIQLIKRLSSKLICNRNQVRRKYPFVNKLKLSKPVYLEEYPENDGNQELETLLQNTTNIYKIKYKHAENWAMVFAQDSDKIQKLNGHFWSINTYFRVMSYEKAKQIFENAFTISGYELKKFYQKSYFDKSEKQNSRNNRNYDDFDDEFNNNNNRPYGNQSSNNEMNDEEDNRFRERYLRNQRGSRLTSQQKEKISYIQPNFNFNASLLANNNQCENEQFNTSIKLSEKREKQIEDILLQFYEQATLSLPVNKNVRQNHMQVQ